MKLTVESYRLIIDILADKLARTTNIARIKDIEIAIEEIETIGTY